jgi:hypothetical protein
MKESSKELNLSGIKRFVWWVFRIIGKFMPNPCNGGNWKIMNIYYTPYHTIEYCKGLTSNDKPKKLLKIQY